LAQQRRSYADHARQRGKREAWNSIADEPKPDWQRRCGAARRGPRLKLQLEPVEVRSVDHDVVRTPEHTGKSRFKALHALQLDELGSDFGG
jgi:hypothetical protein